MRWLFATILLGLTHSPSAGAAPKRPGKGGDVGLGGSLGDPTGGSFKWFLHENHVLESAIGFGPFHLGGGRFHVSYLWHPTRMRKPTEDMHILGYLGVGLGLAFWHKRFIGPLTPSDFNAIAMFFRAPVLGVAFNMNKLPLDIFLEAAYSPLVLPPLTFWNVDFALGARYWF